MDFTAFLLAQKKVLRSNIVKYCLLWLLAPFLWWQVILFLLWIVLFLSFYFGVNKKKEKVPKRKKNQRNHLEFARISRREICTTRAQISSLKIQQFYAHDKQLRCTMRRWRIQAFRLVFTCDKNKKQSEVNSVHMKFFEFTLGTVDLRSQVSVWVEFIPRVTLAHSLIIMF